MKHWRIAAALFVGALLLLSAPHLAAFGLPALTLAVSWPVVARTIDDLNELSNPPSGKGVSEAIPYVWFDTETYTDNVTTSLTFFQTVKTAGLSNMEAAGMLTAPQFFELYCVMFDVLRIPAITTTAIIAAWADTWQILFGGGATGVGSPVFQFSKSQKGYGWFPLSLLHGTGGLHGSNGFGTTGADTPALFATNSVPDGGFWYNGSIMIPPNVGFNIQVAWPTAVNISANVGLKMSIGGTLHRAVV